MDSHKGSLLLSGHHGSALPLSRALNASNSVLRLHCFLKRTEFFHTRTTTDEKPISIITISDDREIGVQFPAEAEHVWSPGDHNRRGAHLASRGAHLASRGAHLASSSSSALQLFMSFGWLNYFFPLFPLLRPLFPVLHSQLSQVISRVVFPS
jgi:hypothetical protein